MRTQPKWQGLSATEFKSTCVKIHVGHATGAFAFQKSTTIVAKFKKNHNLTEGSAQSLGNFSSRTVNKSQGLGWGQPKKVANIIYVLHLNTDQVAANLANAIMGEKKSKDWRAARSSTFNRKYIESHHLPVASDEPILFP